MEMTPSVSLISFSSPTPELIRVGIVDAEQFLVYCARVSNPANQLNTDTAPKLINYLIKNRHWSPFEMVSLTLEINTTRDIGRQILRHRSFSFSEHSQRYAETPDADITRETRLQDRKNRQNSIDNTDPNLAEWWEATQHNVKNLAYGIYKDAIRRGIAKEVARAVLPEGLTASRLYVTGSLRSWITYIALREKNGTQKEHADIARGCKEIVLTKFPALNDALGDLSTPWEI